jgi:hypothetical protein
MFHEKIKHIDIRFNFILDITTLSDIVVKKIDTEDNLTNMLTKSFPLFKLKHCLDLIFIISNIMTSHQKAQ